MAEAKKKWLRYCSGDTCETCDPFCGKLYKEDQEQEAKKKLHPNCKCDAILVEECKPGKQDTDSNIEVNVVSAQGHMNGTYSYSVEVSNSSVLPIRDVNIEVEVNSNGNELGSDTFEFDKLLRGDTESVEGEGSVAIGKIAGVLKNGISVHVHATYTEVTDVYGGEKEEELHNGCYWNLI